MFMALAGVACMGMFLINCLIRKAYIYNMANKKFKCILEIDINIGLLNLFTFWIII